MALSPEKVLGNHGEHLVARALEKTGFSVVARNYTRKQGEVDLIAESHNVVAFVEVKTRSRSIVDTAEVVSRAKQRRIIAAAKNFIGENPHLEKTFRFDVVLIENLDKPTVTYIANAFEEDACWNS